MASNKIQIKRSTANATVTGLSNGELAFTQAGNILYIGAPDGTSGSLRIGGLQVPGTLTANQALVANATSGIDKIITSNAVITTLWANGAAGTNGQVLVTNGSAVYWGTGTSGANTQVQFNDSGVANATAGFTFTKTTNTLFVGNTVNVGSVNAYMNATSFGYVGNTTTSPTVSLANTGALAIGNSSTTQTTSSIAIANSTGSVTITPGTTSILASGLINASSFTTTGSVNTATVYATGLVNAANFTTTGTVNTATVYATGLVNAANFTTTGTVNTATVYATGLVNAAGFSTTGNANATNHYSGANLVVNSAAITWTGNTTTSPTITIANTGVATFGNSSVTAAPQVVVSNSVGTTSINAGSIGTTTVFANLSGSYVNVTGQVNTATIYATTSANIASAVQANSTGVFTTGTVNGAVHSVGSSFIANSLGVYHTGVVNGATVSVGTNFIANSTKVTFTGANIDATSTALAVNAATITSQITVNGNTTLGDASTDVINPVAYFSNNVIPSANVTYNLGTVGNRWNSVFANTVNAVAATFSGTLSVGGDLVVSGNLTTTNVQSVVVSDPMIYLAGNNYTSDLVDIGFAANYFDGATQRHTGFFRDASDGIYRLFNNLTQELSGNNLVDISDPSYRTATLIAYLSSGALTTNSTSANLIANSTYTVGIVANTLTLSTALAGTSGGTGKTTVANNSLLVGNSTNGYNELVFNTTAGYVLQSNGTAIVYDTLDGGTF